MESERESERDIYRYRGIERGRSRGIYIYIYIYIYREREREIDVWQSAFTISGFLLVNLEKWGVSGIFDTFWYGTGYFEESAPEIEISDRDLGFGGDGTGTKENK